MDLKKILPKNGPPLNEVSKYIEKYKNDLIVIKYGGNVFIDRKIFDNFITDILAPFPSGLVIYWTVNNILTMAQQVFIMKRTTVKTAT